MTACCACWSGGGARNGSLKERWRDWTANGPEPGSRATGTWTRRIPTRETWTCLGRDRCSNFCRTARTHIGEDTLARWLLAPADPATVRARQEAVDELRPRVDLREDLAVVAEESRTGVDPVSLAAWGEAPGLLERGRLHAAVRALTALGVVGASALIAYVLSLLGAVRISEAASILLRDVFLVVLAVNATFLYRVHQRIAAVVTAVEEAAHELKLLSEVLVRLERESFHSPLLAALRRLARYRGRAAFQAHRPAQPADGAAGLPRSPAGPAGGTVCAVDHAPGLRRGGVAAALRAGGPPMAHGHRRDGGAVLAGEPCL